MYWSSSSAHRFPSCFLWSSILVLVVNIILQSNAESYACDADLGGLRPSVCNSALAQLNNQHGNAILTTDPGDSNDSFTVPLNFTALRCKSPISCSVKEKSQIDKTRHLINSPTHFFNHFEKANFFTKICCLVFPVDASSGEPQFQSICTISINLVGESPSTVIPWIQLTNRARSLINKCQPKYCWLFFKQPR